jgi:hypothetical protein
MPAADTELWVVLINSADLRRVGLGLMNPVSSQM